VLGERANEIHCVKGVYLKDLIDFLRRKFGEILATGEDIEPCGRSLCHVAWQFSSRSLFAVAPRRAELLGRPSCSTSARERSVSIRGVKDNSGDQCPAV
jgi:hypothetical protein